VAASSQQTSMVQATRKGYPLHAVVSLLFPRCIAKLGKIFGSRDTHQSNWTARSPAFFYFSHKKLYYRRIYFVAAGSAATSTFRALHPWFLSLPFSPGRPVFFSDGSNCLSGVSLRRQLIDAVLLHHLDRSLLILIPWVIFS